MVMVYAGGHFSGGHYNPAVTLGVTLRGKCTWADAMPYMVAQVRWCCRGRPGAFCSSKGPQAEASPPLRRGPDLQPWRKLLGEFLFTFALVYVVLNSATAKGTAGNSFYGLAIGFTVMVGAFAIGPVSGVRSTRRSRSGVSVMGLSDHTASGHPSARGLCRRCRGGVLVQWPRHGRRQTA